MTVSEPLEKLQQSFRSIQSINFDDAQMFTNSIVNAPAITTLLKDPTHDESLLYKIVKPKTNKGPSKLVSTIVESASMDSKPERVDGKILYTLEGIISDKPEDEDSEEDERNPVVKFPKLGPRNAYSRPFIHLENSEDFKETFYQISQVLSKYPNLIDDYPTLINKLNTYEDTYRKLQRDIENLEEEIKVSKAFLEDNYNVSYSPKVKSSASFGSDDPDAQIDIDEAIRREEEEIAQLELQFNKRGY
ncbi:DASH complex subunit, putative [Candida dubliniensis CD36]|uniref:DASH complex subunit SPC34 n=1 Tax=Candida dubliniensis (strain CD36 / ATCC MYA-646 / CBS 7987 / NCPF 3949 / NRRL Y-17841) TaxID=573826 RepID=B9WGF3_CANDC|nr:DASH complex subunit, putative [Candida dubliniensis CD36]CAX42327.1 DASH complex subunit, putative [Candida dubliniensis CD36]